jgi:hypothetical protein
MRQFGSLRQDATARAFASAAERVRLRCVAGRDRATDSRVAADYDAWQKRDLSARRYVYLWADGVYLQARMEEAAECMC